MNILKGKKTHIVAGIMVLKSIILLLVGDMTLFQFFGDPNFNTLLTGMGLSTVRAGIAKGR